MVIPISPNEKGAKVTQINTYVENNSTKHNGPMLFLTVKVNRRKKKPRSNSGIQVNRAQLLVMMTTFPVEIQIIPIAHAEGKINQTLYAAKIIWYAFSGDKKINVHTNSFLIFGQ